VSVTTEEISLEILWQALHDLADAHDAAPLNKHAGVWQCRLDARWTITANGHDTPQEYDALGGFHHQIPPLTVFVEFDDWPAGIIDARGAEIAAGQLANASTLRRAIRDHLRARRWRRSLQSNR